MAINVLQVDSKQVIRPSRRFRYGYTILRSNSIWPNILQVCTMRFYMAKMSYKYLFEAYSSNKCLISGLITGYKYLRKVSEWMKYVISMYYRILSS